MSDRFYKIDDVSRLLKVSRASVYAHIARGELRIVKFGRSTRIDATELDRFIVARSRRRGMPE